MNEGASRMTAGQVTKETTEKEQTAIVTRQPGATREETRQAKGGRGSLRRRESMNRSMKCVKGED